MAKSLIDPNINYLEAVSPPPADFTGSDETYEYEFNEIKKKEIIVLGKKHSSRLLQSKRRFNFIYIYRVEEEKNADNVSFIIKERIGVFEFLTDEMDFSRPPDPLLFDDYKGTPKAVTTPSSLKGEKSSAKIKDIRGSHTDWIDRFMEDHRFGVKETITDGSCFFDTARIALESAGIKMTILQLRSLITDSPDIVDYYNDRLGIFGPAVLELINQWNNGENIKGTIEYILSLYRSQELPIFFSATFNGLQQTLGGGEELQKTNKNYKELAEIIRYAFSVPRFDEGDAILLSEGIQFLVNLATEEAEVAYAAATQQEKDNNEVKPVAKMDILSANLISNEDTQHKEESLEHYKNFIKTANFWAEGKAIIIFEKALNIKTIIVSEEGTIAAMAMAEQKRKKMPSYEDYNAVMCEGPDTTNPDYYIIMTKSVNHYRLITYNGKGIFKRFDDLPTKLKDMIVRLDCPSYNNIREVMEYKARRGGTRRRNKGRNNKKSRRHRC
jgi:hypothetical protein